MVTCQNPKDVEDWRRVNKFYSLRRRLFNTFLGGYLKDTVRKMDAVYCQAKHNISKTREIYNLQTDPGFLPNPVEVSNTKPEKADEPMVCFLGRFDGEKRPELFFELARRFPHVRFIAMGKAHDEQRDQELRKLYNRIPNLEMPGFVEGLEKEQLLERCWVLVNTSVSEGLPVSFLEAAAHRCAILSFHNPDGFASRFGYHASDGNLDQGLEFILEGERWRERGQKGYNYVAEVHEKEKVADMHISAYEAILAG
jgi:glycosyltransferase involved in cell wall biosynthesis